MISQSWRVSQCHRTRNVVQISRYRVNRGRYCILYYERTTLNHSTFYLPFSYGANLWKRYTCNLVFNEHNIKVNNLSFILIPNFISDIDTYILPKYWYSNFASWLFKSMGRVISVVLSLKRAQTTVDQLFRFRSIINTIATVESLAIKFGTKWFFVMLNLTVIMMSYLPLYLHRVSPKTHFSILLNNNW